jgi:hypothetical protein
MWSVKLQQFGRFAKEYVLDWKNIVAHCFIFPMMVLMMIYLPVHLFWRVLIFAAVITMNSLRMRYERKKKNASMNT